MNPAITAALAAAQQSAALDPVARLTKDGAIARDKAAELEVASPAEQAQLEAALRQGLIQRRADGRLFVNVRAVDERNAQLGAQILIGALIALSIGASIVALVALAG